MKLTPSLTQYELNILTPDAAASLVASGCDCGPSLEPASAFSLVASADNPLGQTTWSGIIGVEGELTGDGRYIEQNALRWENLPLPLRYTSIDNGGHDGAQVCGRILTLERKSNGDIYGTGDFDETPIGREAAMAVGHDGSGVCDGVSMDLDSVSFEIRVAKELMGMMEEDVEVERPEMEEDADGRVTVLKINADDEVMATTDARVRAATIVTIPAFDRARIKLDKELALVASIVPLENPPADAVCAHEECQLAPVFAVSTDDPDYEIMYCNEHAPEHEDQPLAEVLVASGVSLVPLEPPAAWFDTPSFDGPTPLTVTPDGRVYGHLAVWGTCHTAYSGQCVEPPHSPSNYAYFRTGSILTREGSEIPVGVITLDTMHAARTLSAADTLAHYEHTGRGAADVTVGEDIYGIWVAGALRPSLSAEKIRTLRASPLSGDWRRIGGSLEMVAALSVNVQGFPVPRPMGLVASGGVMVSLVASGMLAPTEMEELQLSPEDLRYLKQLAAREKQASEGLQTEAEKLAARVRATMAAQLARRAGVLEGGK